MTDALNLLDSFTVPDFGLQWHNRFNPPYSTSIALQAFGLYVVRQIQTDTLDKTVVGQLTSQWNAALRNQVKISLVYPFIPTDNS